MCARRAEGAIDILLVEDNPGDVVLTREALKSAKVDNCLHVVGDGEAAMRFLARTDAFVGAPRPDLVLLDLNLPKKSGSEVLSSMKADSDLRSIPVIVLSTSDNPDDINRSYHLYANCYVCKPDELPNFREVVRKIDEFWFGTAELPKL